MHNNLALILSTPGQIRRAWHNYSKKPYNNFPIYLTHASPRHNISKSSFYLSSCQPCKRLQSKDQKIQLNSLVIIYLLKGINDRI